MQNIGKRGLTAISALVAACLLSPPVAGQTAPEACLSTGHDFDALLSSLEADGWTLATEAPEDRDLIAWTLMIPYVTGDRGGETTETLLDLQRRTVPGLFAKRDTDTTMARVLLRDGAALTLTETRTLPGRTERVCHLASETGGEGIEGQIDTTGFEGAPAVLAQVITIRPGDGE